MINPIKSCSYLTSVVRFAVGLIDVFIYETDYLSVFDFFFFFFYRHRYLLFVENVRLGIGNCWRVQIFCARKRANPFAKLHELEYPFWHIELISIRLDNVLGTSATLLQRCNNSAATYLRGAMNTVTYANTTSSNGLYSTQTCWIILLRRFRSAHNRTDVYRKFSVSTYLYRCNGTIDHKLHKIMHWNPANCEITRVLHYYLSAHTYCRYGTVSLSYLVDISYGIIRCWT